jgi:filamentous hemagglutinin family protein
MPHLTAITQLLRKTTGGCRRLAGVRGLNVLRAGAAVLALAGATATPGIALANPTGASIAHGSAVFAAPDAATLNITTSNGAIINWQQFGINPGEVTRFLQQGGSAAVLNRVVGGDPSAILGSLLSNGRVFLINPNGVVFGPNSAVDTAGLVVSTLNMSDDDFINGRLHFQGDGASRAVVNQGQIRAQGSIILIAPRIENSGLIETAGGGLLLAAGREVTITSFENPEIAYQLQAPENEVVNLGQLIANGGAASVFAGSIRHSGEIDASSVVVGKDGRVQLVASGDVRIEAGSSISANGARGGELLVHSVEGTVRVEDATLSARGEAGTGGQIHVLGKEVSVVGSSTVDASGRDGGGEILIGGDYQGANPDIANADNTRLGADAELIANATGSGDGGKVIVWSDGTTQSAGDISARGGPNGGNGGFVEVSGKQALGFSSHVNTLAPHGSPGLLLLDPFNIIAALGGIAPLIGVDQASDSSIGPVGTTGCDGVTCTVDTAAINGALSPVTLQATNDITIANAINISTVGISFTAQANNDILVNAPITTNNAAILLQANQSNNGAASGTGRVVINAALNSTGGDVDVMAGDSIDMTGGSINAGSGRVDLLVAGGIAAGDIVLGDIATTGDVTVINQNTNTGSNILRSGITAVDGTRVLLEIEFTDGSIGTSGTPIRIGDGVQLEAHGHSPSVVPIFIQGLGDLIIGDGGGGAIEGIDSPSGVIEIDVAGTLTLLGGGLPGPVQSGGGGGDDITLTAGSGIVINAEINADTDVVKLDAGVGSIVQDANGTITAGKFKVTSHDGITLDLAANNVGQFTAHNTANGNIDFETTGGAVNLADDGFGFAVRNQASGGRINIKAAGGISLADAVIATPTGNVTLDPTGGGISQFVSAAITGGVLNILNTNTANLSTALNNIIGLSGSGITGGGLMLTNNSGGSALALNNINLTADLDVTNTGGISVTGTVDAGSTNDITLDEQSADINGAGAELLVASNINLLAAGGVGNGTALHVDPLGTLTVNTSGAANAGNVAVKFSNAASTFGMGIITAGTGQQSVYVETISGALTVDSAFGNSADAVELNAAANSINYSSGSVSGASVTLTADAAIGTPGVNSLKTQTGILNASSVSGGAIAIDNTGAVSVTGLSSPGSGVIELNQTTGTGNVSIDGAVNAGGAGPVRLRANSGTLNINANVSSTSLIVLETTGGPINDLSIGAGVTVQASGVSSGVTVNSTGNVLHDGTVRSQQGNVSLTSSVDYNMGSAAVARSDTGTASISAGMGVILGSLEAPIGALTVSATGGAIIDGNGGSQNASGMAAGFAAMSGVGTTTNPIETQVASLTSAASSIGSIAIANTGILTLVSSITAASGDLLLSGSTGLDTAFQTLSSSGAMTLRGGGGLLQIDGLNITAGTAFSANAADIAVNSSTVNGNTLLFNSSGSTFITAGAGPVSLTASDTATFNAGTFKIEGGGSAGDSAKVQATNTVTVNATDVIVQGGSGSGAFASIDPITVLINATNDILVQAGSVSGAHAEIVANNLVNLNAGRNIDVIGDADYAVIESSLGDVVLSALGAVTLTAGAGSNADAVIDANGGSGTVDITSNSCVNCVLLGFDPFANATPDQGIYASAVNLMSPLVATAPASAVGAAQDDSFDISDRDVLVLEDLAEKLAVDRRTSDDDDDDDDQKICR